MSAVFSSSQPSVSAVTVNWNGLNDTIECVESLLSQTHRLTDIVVVDNGSDGDDASSIAGRFGDAVTVLRNDTNTGCAGGYNSGLCHLATRPATDFILVLNNDVVAHPDMVAELVKAARADHRIGIVGPRIFYHDIEGRKDIIWSAGGTIHRWGLKIHKQRGDGEQDGPEFDVPRSVDWTSGAAFLLTPEAIRDGGPFNTWYFIGHEDIEFCLKAAAAGHSIVYAPQARAWHKVSMSARKLGITYADPAAYFYLIRHTFPKHVYRYHLALFPLLLMRWGILYLAKSRDGAQLRRFVADMRRFVSRGKPQ